MKTVAPDYYKNFMCIADKCNHTCCKGWEIEIDNDSMIRFEKYPDINKHIIRGDDNHFNLLEGEVCPFLNGEGLCNMILEYGEEMLCQTCTDHPRFRNYWADRVEVGLGLVCEEAARLILSQKKKMTLEILSADNDEVNIPDDEEWLLEIRNNMIGDVEGDGPLSRLKEYLIYRHIPDALYDNRLDERVAYINYIIQLVESRWQESDNSFSSLIEIVQSISYDYEYDEEVKENILETILG